nr:MAG TPA: ATP11 protein [Caudoviricetes sp.]
MCRHKKNTDKHPAYPCFLLPLPRSTPAQKMYISF